MKTGDRLWPRLSVLFVAITVLTAARAAAEPLVRLKVPAYPAASFANYSAVVLPASGYDSLEVLLEDALAQLQASTVRITLNGMPMTPFVSINPMPAGMRVVVRLGLSLSPDYSIKREGES